MLENYFNSGLDSRSMFNYIEEDKLYDIVQNYNINEKQKEEIYGLMEFTCDDFDIELDKYGIKVHFKYDGYTGGTYGGLAQNDPFTTSVEIIDKETFKKEYKKFTDFLDKGIKEKYYSDSFSTYIEYEGTSIQYIENIEGMFINRISLNYFEIEIQNEYIESIYMNNYEAVQKIIDNK